MSAEFFRWLREWDPACQTVHTRIYPEDPTGDYVPVLCADGFPTYTREQAIEIHLECAAVRSSSWHGKTGSTRIVEVDLLARLIISSYDGAGHDVADLTDRLRESQGNVKLPGRVAYTIGNEANYDAALAECRSEGKPMRKTGKGDQGKDPEYPGGFVWASAMSARLGAEASTEANGCAYAVYEIELQGPWSEVTYPCGSGHNLLHDAVIVGKVVQP